MASITAAQHILESIPSEFDYFDSTVIQAAIIKEWDRPFGPFGNFPQRGQPFTFEVPGSPNLYLDLNNSKLEIQCKLLRVTGENIAADANIAPINNVLHSMFEKMEIFICDKLIGDQNDYYPFRAYIETMLTYDDNMAKTRLRTQGWEKDTPGQFDEMVQEDTAQNLGFRKRSLQFSGSRLITLLGRPHIDIFHQDKDIPPNCNLKLRLTPSRNQFLIKKPDTINFDVYMAIQTIKFWVHTKEVSPSLLMAHETMLQKHNFRIPFKKVCLKTSTIDRNVRSVELDGLLRGPLPERLVIGFIENDRMVGNYSQNPFRFHHFNLTELYIVMNGQQIPSTPFQPRFNSGEYIREYMSLLEGLNLDIGTKSIDLTPEEWSEAFPIFIFRLSPGGLPSVPKSGDLKLKATFAQPLRNTTNIVCYYEYPALLEIDRYRNAITH